MSKSRPSDKDIASVFRCIDRYNRVPDDYGYYRISSKELKKAAYSGRYKPVIEWLVSEGFIEVDNFYISGSRFKGYRPIRRPDVLFDAPEDELAPAYSDELCEAVAANLKLFTHTGEWVFDQNKDRYRQERYSEIWDSDFRGNVTRRSGGRMFSILINSVSSLRPQLLIDDEPPSIVDISSAQPWLMALITEDEALLADVLARTFYTDLPLGKPPVIKGIRKTEEEWQKAAYGKIFLKLNMRKEQQVEKARMYVEAKYSKAFNWSINLRKKSESPAKVLQQEEARFVLDHVLRRLIDEDVICAPIHDAIMCKASEAEYVQDVFKEEAKRLYGSNILTHIE